MKYVVAEWRGEGDDLEFAHDPRAYLAELPNLRSALPPGAWDFASAPGHYDLVNAFTMRPPRCVKDLNLRGLPPTDPVPVSFDLRLEGANAHECAGLTLSYQGVTEVEIETDDGKPFSFSDWNSLRLDEILPHPQGCTHEMIFTDARILIACADLQARWDPPCDHS
ncbi:hypothetical protein [Actinomadura hibisca]|uniref:hypothetical protein n=1 Tax=Actinomadura hibisca TaxID=68565 RepID=UPI00082C5B28|nr:hypothetical protein [Actinomadura hibisca]